MRKYKFEYRSNDDPDYPERTKFVDCFESYLADGETDIDEFAREARQFLLARGFHENTASGLQYIHWRYGCPDYNDEYLISLENQRCATVDRWEDDRWLNHNKENIKAWAEMPYAMGETY